MKHSNTCRLWIRAFVPVVVFLSLMVMVDRANSQSISDLLGGLGGLTLQPTTLPSDGEEGGGGTSGTVPTEELTLTPGQWIQRAIGVQTAVRNRDYSSFSGVPAEQPSFAKEVFTNLFKQVTDMVSGLLTVADTLIKGFFQDPSNPGGTEIFIPIPNAATTGQGQTLTVD